jgi:hypothetical protein
MHTQPLNVPPSFPIAAIYKNTAPSPTSPWVMPGNYVVKLTVNGKAYTQPIEVKMDPRIHTPTAGLQQQYDLSVLCTNNRRTISNQLGMLAAVQQQAEELKDKAGKNLLVELDSLISKVKRITNGKPDNLSSFQGSFAGMFGLLQEADVAPIPETITTIKGLQQKFSELEEQVKNITLKTIPAMNKQLQKEGLSKLEVKE